MTDRPTAESVVVVRFWAAAKAAAGVAEERVPLSAPATLTALVDAVVSRHGSDALARILGLCAVIVDGTPVGSRDRHDVVVRPGQHIEFLPPFAGG